MAARSKTKPARGNSRTAAATGAKRTTGPKRAASAKKTSSKKAAKRTPAKKVAAKRRSPGTKRTAAKRSAPKRAAAKRTTTKRAAAKRTTTKRAAAKRTTKRAAPKRAAARSAVSKRAAATRATRKPAAAKADTAKRVAPAPAPQGGRMRTFAKVPGSKPAPTRKSPDERLAEEAASRETPRLVRRREPGGRPDAEYVADLLEKSGEPSDENDRAFLDSPNSEDQMVEDIGEGFVQSATSGEDTDEEQLDPKDESEEGGPFVVTTGEEEFGREPDASNPEDAEPAAFPTTQSEG